MTTIKATVKGRRLELDVPDDWPDGIEVEIQPFGQETHDDDDATSSEEVARTLAAMDKLEGVCSDKTFPDGIEVDIQPSGRETHGDNDVMTPDEIARTLAAMDQFEPFHVTDAEQAAWETERKARKEWEKARFAEHAEQLQRLWS